jgi:hypothetical protein
MPDAKDPKANGAITREPEAYRTSIERQDSTGEDIGGAPADPETAGAPDQIEEPLPDPFFWPDERNTAPVGPGATTSTPIDEREEIEEIMARAMRWRSVEANKIIVKPADIQSYVETCWMDELPAAQAAHAALEAAGYTIVRDNR